VVPVMAAHTREHQEALAAMPTHNKKFSVMGGEHVTLDDMFKAAEVNRWIEEATEREKGKKNWVEYHARHKATLPILDCLENDHPIYLLFLLRFVVSILNVSVIYSAWALYP